MTTTTSSQSTVIAVAEPVFTNAERLALAGFLAGYTGLTRDAYALDLRQYASWCHQHRVSLFDARRPGIECFARDLEPRGRARATVTRRLCRIAGFCRYAVEEELLDHSPAAHVRRPRLDYESRATPPDTHADHGSWLGNQGSTRTGYLCGVYRGVARRRVSGRAPRSVSGRPPRRLRFSRMWGR
jgi:hypothetical protein